MNLVILCTSILYYTLEAFIAEMWEILEIECALARSSVVAEVRDLPKISLFRTKVALYMDIGKVCSYTHRAKAKAESAFCSTNTSISIWKPTTLRAITNAKGQRLQSEFDTGFIGVNIYISGRAGLYSLSQAWLLAYEGPLQEQQQINHLSFSSMAYQGHSRRG